LEWAGREAPADDRVWLGRANLATRMGLYDEAASWLDRCESRRPTDPAVWRARLDWARSSGDPEAVLRTLGKPAAGRLRPAEEAARVAGLGDPCGGAGPRPGARPREAGSPRPRPAAGRPPRPSARRIAIGPRPAPGSNAEGPEPGRTAARIRRRCRGGRRPVR